MAGKRTATSELNHDNWEEYEREEAGTFKKASEDVIQRRVIKTARRRNPISSSSGDSESSAKNVFSNFGGFTKPSTPSPFAFLTDLTNKQTNGLDNNKSGSNSTVPTIWNSIKMSESSSLKPAASASATENDKSSEKPMDYYAKLKGLNESVSQWIKTHVDKNPFCILTPIFKDYEKYLTNIENDSNKSTEPNDTNTVGFAFSAQSSHTTSIFGSSPSQTSLSKPVTDEKPKQTNTITSTSTTTSGFSLGTSTLATSSSGFSFSSGTPFTFANVSKPTSTEPSSEETQEEDEPPKVEFKPVVEDGSVFSKRCKVFVKKDGAFGDRGVGTLFLKPITGSEKIQLIVRADTNIGNLLLNFILSDSIPTQRMGKNNVMLVCVPNPDSKPPPTPVLLRVKTGEEADELLKVLEKHKK